jgi:K+-transporting ATPase KdpF subunit
MTLLTIVAAISALGLAGWLVYALLHAEDLA